MAGTRTAAKPPEAPPEPVVDAAADEPVTLAKVVEVVKQTVSDLLGGDSPAVKDAPDPLDAPATLRDLESFAAKQMRGEQDKIKAEPKAPPPPKDEAGEKAPQPKPDPHVEQAPQVKPGWRERLWS
jgi:hypothetical protein